MKIRFESWRYGTKVSEETPEESRQWSDYGVLASEHRTLPGGRAITRRFYDDGSFDSEIHYLNGQVVPPPDAGTPH